MKKIDKLGNIPVNSLFDSELEGLFIEAIAQMGNENRKVEISKSLINDKEGYILKVNGSSWEIEPQVSLGPTQGISVQCKPDFIIRPTRFDGHKASRIINDDYRKNFGVRN